MLKKYWKIIIALLISITLMIFVIFPFRSNDKDRNEQESTTSEIVNTTENETRETVSTTERETETITEIIIGTEENPLLKDDSLEIRELMERFYQAKFNCEVETLHQLVGPFDSYSEESLYEERYGKKEDGLLELESYQVEACYSKKGLTDETYFVWALVNMKYKNADTPAPALFRMYVCKNENGYYIYNDTLSEEVKEYRDEISSKEDVLNLIDVVNQRLKEAVSQDEQLKNLVLSIKDEDEKTDPEETVADLET